MNKPFISVILFDLGGTLVQKLNHGSRDPEIISQMIDLLGAKCSPEEMITFLLRREKEYKDWSYRSLDELSYEERWCKYLLPDYPQNLVRQNASQLQAWWSESCGKRWIPSEKIHILRQLKNRGYTLATVSHTSTKYLDQSGIRDLFKITLQAADFGKRKPHPAPFIAAARECGVSPRECAYIGDKPSRDVIGSREAGIGQVIIIEPEQNLVEDYPCPMQADRTLTEFDELLEIFPEFSTNLSEQEDNHQSIKLYDAALSTMWWSRDRYSANEFCAQGRKLGFARFELNHQITPEELKTFDLNRYHMGSVHDPCPAVVPNKQLEREDRQITSLDERLRRCGVDVLKRSIELAYSLGSRLVVIHPGRVCGDHSLDDQLRDLYRSGQQASLVYGRLKEQVIQDRQKRGIPHLDQLIKSMQEIIEFSKNSGVFLGLENRLHYYELPIFDEMKILLETFYQPWVGWQLDVGHIRVNDVLGLMSFQQWLDAFSERIVGVHLHDVKGIDDHKFPGTGEVDFKWLSSYLPAYAYRALEINHLESIDGFAKGLQILEKTGCITSV